MHYKSAYSVSVCVWSVNHVKPFI